MNCIISHVQRICFCIPLLRYGLLVWAYFLLIPMGFYSLTIFITVLYTECVPFFPDLDYRNLPVVITIIVGNLMFNLFLIMAARMKCILLLKIYNACALSVASANIGLFMSMVIGCPYSFYTDPVTMRSRYVLFLISLTALMVVIGMQMYIFILVKSEIMKSKNKHTIILIIAKYTSDPATSPRNLKVFTMNMLVSFTVRLLQRPKKRAEVGLREAICQ